MMISDMWDDEVDERVRQDNCHHCYGWSANDRCLACGKDMMADPDQEDKYEFC